MQDQPTQLLRKQAWRAIVAWLVLGLIWIPVRFFQVTENTAYLLLPGIMATPILAVWAAAETLTLGLAWRQRSSLRPRPLSRLRWLALLCIGLIALLLMSYASWRDEQVLRAWHEQQQRPSKASD